MEQYVTKNQKQLRCGITTGTCVTAAAKVAAMRLLLGVEVEKVELMTPKGIKVSVPVKLKKYKDQSIHGTVIKDSGDDPDVTHQAKICASVRILGKDETVSEHAFAFEEAPHLYLDGGIGVGRITQIGLEQKIGQAAINRVPRAMIFQAVSEVYQMAECTERILITAYVPKGEELAKRTFNERLGILGGISILGTSGIIEPMSEQAIVDTIETQIRQLHRQGQVDLLVTPGNYGQGYVSDHLGLSLEDSVKCSNYIGDTIDLAISYGMKRFLLVGNIGKLVKLAAGIMNTHSKMADGRKEVLAVHTVLSGGTREMVEKIMGCITTEEILTLLEEWQLQDAVMKRICNSIEEYMEHRIKGKMECAVMIFSNNYGFLGQTSKGEEVLSHFR